jgi:hypothetical protein
MTTFASVWARSVVTFWVSRTNILVLGTFVYFWNIKVKKMWNRSWIEEGSYWNVYLCRLSHFRYNLFYKCTGKSRQFCSCILREPNTSCDLCICLCLRDGSRYMMEIKLELKKNKQNHCCRKKFKHRTIAIFSISKIARIAFTFVRSRKVCTFSMLRTEKFVWAFVQI